MKEATAGVSSRGIMMATDGMLKSKGSTMMPFPGKVSFPLTAVVF